MKSRASGQALVKKRMNSLDLEPSCEQLIEEDLIDNESYTPINDEDNHF